MSHAISAGVHSTVTTTKGPIGQPLSVATMAGEAMLPWLSEIEGFEGLLMLSNEENGTTLVLTFWESREVAERHRAARRASPLGPDLLRPRELGHRARPVAFQAAVERLLVAGADLDLLRVERRVAKIRRPGPCALEELADPGRGRPHRLVEDLPAAAEHPTHVRQAAVGAVDGAGEIIDEDRAGDSDLVAQTRGGGVLVVERSVWAEKLARVRLTRVEEVPAPAGKPRRKLVEQRTLCCAVRSGERAELEHDACLLPQVGEADALAVEGRQLAVRRALARVERVRKRAELAHVLARLDVQVEAFVVVVGHAGAAYGDDADSYAETRSFTVVALFFFAYFFVTKRPVRASR